MQRRKTLFPSKTLGDLGTPMFRSGRTFSFVQKEITTTLELSEEEGAEIINKYH